MKIKKAAFITVSAVVLSVVSIFSLRFFGDTELQKVTVKKSGSDEFILTVSCLECEKYTVSRIDANETAAYGEEYRPINADLGANRMKVILCDSKVSDDFKEMYKPWTTYALEDSDGNANFMWCYTPDHGIAVYVGTEIQMNIEEGEFKKSQFAKNIRIDF